MPDELKKTILQAVILGVVAAIVVWLLEDFNGRRMVAQLRRELDEWASGGQQGPMSHGS